MDPEMKEGGIPAVGEKSVVEKARPDKPAQGEDSVIEKVDNGEKTTQGEETGIEKAKGQKPTQGKMSEIEGDQGGLPTLRNLSVSGKVDLSEPEIGANGELRELGAAVKGLPQELGTTETGRIPDFGSTGRREEAGPRNLLPPVSMFKVAPDGIEPRPRNNLPPVMAMMAAAGDSGLGSNKIPSRTETGSLLMPAASVIGFNSFGTTAWGWNDPPPNLMPCASVISSPTSCKPPSRKLTKRVAFPMDASKYPGNSAPTAALDASKPPPRSGFVRSSEMEKQNENPSSKS